MINITSWHLELSSRCVISCPKCPRTTRKGDYTVTDLSLQKIKKFFNDEVLRDAKDIILCGNHGDPIYNYEFHKIISFFREHEKPICLITNGSSKNSEWWEKTASILNSKYDRITFSIDGLEDTNHLYRVGSKWDTVINAVKICVKNNVKVTWKFIVFKHNEHQIEAATTLASELGIYKFEIVKSNRFDKKDLLRPNDKWISKKVIKNRDDPIDLTEENIIDPICEFGKKHYISADGIYYPCCWIANAPAMRNTIFYKNSDQFNIDQNSLKDIQLASQMLKFKGSWKDYKTSPNECKRFCTSTKYAEKNDSWKSPTIDKTVKIL